MTSRKKINMLTLIAVVITALSFFLLKMSNDTKQTLIKSKKEELIYRRAVDLLKNDDFDKAINNFAAVIKQAPRSPYSEDSLRILAAIYEKRGDDAKSEYYFRRLLSDFPDTEDAEEIKTGLEDKNLKTLLSPKRTEDSVEYTVQSGDSLYAIARKFKTTIGLIKKMNNLTSDTIRVGQKLKVNVAQFSILVDKATNILILEKDKKPFKTYTVATGRENSTPVGEFVIINRLVKPDWTKPGIGIIKADSKDYELGERWMGISAQGYGIHGTNDETSIGSQSTAGCVRMKNSDVIELFEMVPNGTVVAIVDKIEQI
jgi:LysM repeat protein